MSIKVVMVDNYDSFTYNLVQYFGELGADVTVVRNDQVTIEDIEKFAPDKLVIRRAHARRKKPASRSKRF
jgi:anthranilate synthase component 2